MRLERQMPFQLIIGVVKSKNLLLSIKLKYNVF